MSQHLLSAMPLELLLKIIQCLAFQTRLDLASVNSKLRQALIPTLFSKIRVTNEESDSHAIQHVVTKFGQHIRSIHFECYLYQGQLDISGERLKLNEQDDDEEKKLCTLPTGVAKILSGHGLDQTQAMVVEFVSENDFEGEEWGDEMELGGIYIFMEVESNEEILEMERQRPWRKVMSQVWDNISNNRSIECLEIRNLLAREPSSWDTPKWRSFLGQLQKLSLRPWGGDNGVGWQANTTQGYVEFLGDLDKYFLDHCSSLIHLEIVAHEDCSFGGRGNHCAELPLSPNHLNTLKTLQLRNCIIDGSLVEFLVTHSKTLQCLALIDCNAYMDEDYAFTVLSWADLFRDVHASNPSLQSLVVTNAVIPLTEDEEGGYDVDVDGNPIIPDYLPENVKALKRLIHSGEKRPFSYASLDSGWGTVGPEPEENVARLEAGDDQREYERLMSLIRKKHPLL